MRPSFLRNIKNKTITTSLYYEGASCKGGASFFVYIPLDYFNAFLSRQLLHLEPKAITTCYEKCVAEILSLMPHIIIIIKNGIIKKQYYGNKL